MLNSKRKRILCIDDSPDNLDYHCFVLSGAGYEVETANNGIEGLEIASRSKFDLYFLDLFFPNENGFDLIKQFHELDTSVPIVVCSAGVQEWVRDKAIQAGARAFLGKPIAPSSLLETIARFLV